MDTKRRFLELLERCIIENHQKIKDGKYIILSDQYCPICLEKEVKCYKLNCSHYVCIKCLPKLQSIKCPYCRSEISQFMVSMP